MFAFESMASVLDRDEKKRQEKEDNKKDNFIDLGSLYKVYINPDAIKKYEDKFAQLSHIDKNANKLRGYMYFANTAVGKKGDLVAFVSVKLESGKTWIDTLEVTPEYRGNKLSHQLLDIACSEFGATDMKVNKHNDFALRIFKKYGFVEYDRKENTVFLSNDSVTTSNPVQKHDNNSEKTETASESYVEKYINDNCPECLLVANESIFGKPSRDELIDSAIKKISKKIKSKEQKQLFLKKITDNERVYKQTIAALKKLESKHDKGTISEKDYAKQKKMAINLLHKVMIEFNININNFIDNKKQPTREELSSFGDIISQIKKSVSSIKF